MILPLLVALAACATRPMTEAERAFTGTVMGPELDARNVRFVKGAVVALIPVTVQPRPQTTCREKLFPEITEPFRATFPAFARGQTVYYSRGFWSEDFLEGYPDVLDLEHAMRLAHELTHVWQWQQRTRTGYSPFAAALEHVGGEDPYLVDIDPDLDFSDYAWEQQGSIVEEFVCCRALDPEGVRTGELAHLVRQAFPAASDGDGVPLNGVRLPWDGAETRGICS